MNFFRKVIEKYCLNINRFKTKVSKFDYLKTLNINTVIDIGANVGQFAIEIRKILPGAQIYSFEPVKKCFEQLNINMKRDCAFRSFNFALGAEEGEAVINISTYTPSSSILPMSNEHKILFPHAQDGKKEVVLIKKLDNVLLDLNLKKEILVKVDVQGFENKVLKGGINTFSIAKAVLIETSFLNLYEGQCSFDELYEMLKSMGYMYRGAIQQKINKQTGEIICEDSLFVKK